MDPAGHPLQLEGRSHPGRHAERAAARPAAPGGGGLHPDRTTDARRGREAASSPAPRPGRPDVRFSDDATGRAAHTPGSGSPCRHPASPTPGRSRGRTSRWPRPRRAAASAGSGCPSPDHRPNGQAAGTPRVAGRVRASRRSGRGTGRRRGCGRRDWYPDDRRPRGGRSAPGRRPDLAQPQRAAVLSSAPCTSPSADPPTAPATSSRWDGRAHPRREGTPGGSLAVSASCSGMVPAKPEPVPASSRNRGPGSASNLEGHGTHRIARDPDDNSATSSPPA